jgi:L-2-hydroxyglutarate oxidase
VTGAAASLPMYDYAVIGGGILGLSAAMELTRRHPHARLVVLEKEAAIARHQSGRSSGVIHSGIYYRPGSLKARFASAGNRAMVEFCEEHGITHEVCGKVIVATEPQELERLEALYRRGLENGLDVARLDSEELAELEPHVRSLAAIRVPSTGIVDFVGVCRAYARAIEEGGGELRLGARVERVARRDRRFDLETPAGTVVARTLVNCGGLYSDRIARMAGARPPARIVPFRGEYYELRAEKRGLVRGLVYPVPDPDFPFLGVHLTRMVDGSVHAGPNAVLALRREGYRRRDVSFRDALDIAAFGGFWRLAARHFGEGVREVRRSLSRKAFVRSLQRLVPEIGPNDVVPAAAGVRAQALTPDGRLVDDFLIVEADGAVHVCNAPSPGATSSLQIGRAIADRVPVHERVAVAV